MGKIDLETVEEKILEIVQNNLPAKITEINTEKGDALLEQIPNKDYYSDFYQEELTASLFIHYGIAESQVQSVRGDFATTWNIFYNVLVEQQNDLSNIRKKILRYTRALQEVITDNADKISRYTTSPEILSIAPEDLTDITNQTPFKMGGIIIRIIVA